MRRHDVDLVGAAVFQHLRRFGERLDVINQIILNNDVTQMGQSVTTLSPKVNGRSDGQSDRNVRYKRINMHFPF